MPNLLQQRPLEEIVRQYAAQQALSGNRIAIGLSLPKRWENSFKRTGVFSVPQPCCGRLRTSRLRDTAIFERSVDHSLQLLPSEELEHGRLYAWRFSKECSDQ